MYNYGTGCGYNYGGYTGGFGYGNYAPVTGQTPAKGGFAFILVLFILLVLIGCCCGFDDGRSRKNCCGCGF